MSSQRTSQRSFDGFDGFNRSVNDGLSFVDSTPYVKSLLMLFTLVFLHLVAPTLPPEIIDIFGTFWFRSIVASGIAYVAFYKKDWKLALALGVGMMILINLINGKTPFEDFREGFDGPVNAIYPGCLNMTTFDLVRSFNHDKEALANAMLIARVPLDISINDYHAPLIATYLLNAGYKLVGTCNPPGYGDNSGSPMTYPAGGAGV